MPLRVSLPVAAPHGIVTAQTDHKGVVAVTADERIGLGWGTLGIIVTTVAPGLERDVGDVVDATIVGRTRP
jgi:hypothetical protein